MDEDFEVIPTDPWQHIQDLLSGVTDGTGSPVLVSPLFDQLASAFYDSSSRMTSAASPTNDRNTGYMAFHQSLTTYTINLHDTLSTPFLEQLLLQAISLLPITKIASCLQLGDNQYDSCYDSGDRLLILLGVLASSYGSSAVDSLMHPLFEKYIFSELSPPQSDQGQSVMQFENLIRVRGALDIYYQQLEVTHPQPQNRWECTITYKLGPTTCLLLHHRTGKTKKQAKLRIFHDIYNYYLQSKIPFFLSDNTWNTYHPHCQPLGLNSNKINTMTLPIPTEQMYEYDDDTYENLSLVERAQKQNNAHYIHIPVGTDNDDGCIELLTQSLLGDDSDDASRNNNSSSSNNNNNNNNNNDSPKTSPLPGLHDQRSPSLPASASSSSLSSSSPFPSSPPSALTSPKLGPGPTIGDELDTRHPPVMKMANNTTATTAIASKTGILYGSQKEPPVNRNALPITINSHGSVSNITNAVDSPGKQLPSTPTTSQPQSAAAKTASGSTFSSEEVLVAKAKKIMNELTLKERYRLNEYGENLRRNPNDAKGVLMNLAHKLDNGYYRSSAELVQLGKPGERAHYIVTLRFGIPNVEVTLARGHTKKSTAEGMAATAVIALFEKVSKVINSEMDLPYMD